VRRGSKRSDKVVGGRIEGWRRRRGGMERKGRKAKKKMGGVWEVRGGGCEGEGENGRREVVVVEGRGYRERCIAA